MDVDWDANMAEQLGFSHLKPLAAVAFKDLTNFNIYLDFDKLRNPSLRDGG